MAAPSFILEKYQVETYTEADWFALIDTDRAINYLASIRQQLLLSRRINTDRVLRFFVMACARQMWAEFPVELRHAVQMTEKLNDYSVESISETLTNVRFQADMVLEKYPKAKHRLAFISFDSLHPVFENCGATAAAYAFADGGNPKQNYYDHAPFPGYLRDLVYNPFRTPPTFDEEWLFRNVNAVYLLAQEIYYDYRFDLMPKLADALENAGCTNAEILEHCRANHPHIRGCWVVDGLLKPDVDPLKRLLSRNPIPGDRLAAYLMTDDPKDPFTLYRG